MSDTDHKGSLNDELVEIQHMTSSLSPPDDTYAGIHTKLESRHKRRLRLRIISAAACTIAVVSAIVVMATPRYQVGGFDLLGASTGASVDLEGIIEVEMDNVQLRDPDRAIDMVASRGTRLHREARGIRLLRGTADFTVMRRHGFEPARILVSLGAIEVLGTQFHVLEHDGAGSVTVTSGVVRFVSAERGEYVLRAGQTLHWPEDLTATQATDAADQHNDGAEPTAPETGSMIVEPPPDSAAPPGRNSLRQAQDSASELETLRIRHEYGRLAARLREVLATNPSEPQREQLDFELCSVLASHSNNTRRACTTIARHLRDYPHGDYTNALHEMQSTLSCAP